MGKINSYLSPKRRAFQGQEREIRGRIDVATVVPNLILLVAKKRLAAALDRPVPSTVRTGAVLRSITVTKPINNR